MTPAIGLSAETLAASERANAEAHALAECIAEYCRQTRVTLANVRYLRRAIAGDPAPPAAPVLNAVWKEQVFAAWRENDQDQLAALDHLDQCTYETRHSHGGTGEFDEVFQCRELGTVTNLADAAANDSYDSSQPDQPDCPGGVYCLAHHQQREKERADNYEPPQSYAQRTLVISAADPDFA
jgi:hypothetical protein